MTAEQRREDRRARLLDAGLAVFGERGYANATVRSVIAESGLGERYFYENFADLDELLIAVAERIHDEILEETLLAVAAAGDDVDRQVRDGLRAFVAAMTRDRRKARIKLIEMVGASERVQRRRREAMLAIAGLIAARAPDVAADGIDAKLIALALVGAVNELMIEWFFSAGKMPVERLLDHAVALFDGMIALNVGASEPGKRNRSERKRA